MQIILPYMFEGRDCKLKPLYTHINWPFKARVMSSLTLEEWVLTSNWHLTAYINPHIDQNVSLHVASLQANDLLCYHHDAARKTSIHGHGYTCRTPFYTGSRSEQPPWRILGNREATLGISNFPRCIHCCYNRSERWIL